MATLCCQSGFQEADHQRENNRTEKAQFFSVRLIAGLDIRSEPVDVNVQLACMVLLVTFIAQGDKIYDVVAPVFRERNQMMTSCFFLIVVPANNA